MGHGNPNQKKLVAQLREWGFTVQVKRNQIHVKGVTRSPFHPGASIESGYAVRDGETYGMTIREAREFLRLEGLA